MTDQLNPSPLPVERSQAAVSLDNLIRRHLRVSDPSDPEAISKALRERYADEQQALDQEAAGLPFFKVTRTQAGPVGEGVLRAEERQAKDDVHKDLTALTTNAVLKDIHPELQGWAHHLRQVVADGTNAARFAIDPHQRDRAMAARRLLGDYARVARYVGALSPNMSIHYRQLAKSLDEVAGVILVSMGEGIAQFGNGAGRFLLQAPASELAARRDAVINALRALVGTTGHAFGPNDFPRSLAAYRQALNFVSDNGMTDLRAVFQENHVARSLDDVVFWATRGSSDDLRALGATALLALERFRRLELLLRRQASPLAPALAAYLTAIRLFLDIFENAGAGYRLLYIARPPITFYGLYGIGGPDGPTQRLLSLIQLRGQLAQILDCYLGCECGEAEVRCQIMLDKLLYDTDRAIDLYALSQSTQGNGPAEQRAVAYGVVADRLLRCAPGTVCEPECAIVTSPETDIRSVPPSETDPQQVPATEVRCDEPPSCAVRRCVDRHLGLADILQRIRGELWYPGSLSLVAPPPPAPWDPPHGFTNGDCPVWSYNTFGVEALTAAHDELCVQEASEAQWEHLLTALSPGCRLQRYEDGRLYPDPLSPVRELIAAARAVITGLAPGVTCPPDLEVPPHYEISLHDIANPPSP